MTRYNKGRGPDSTKAASDNFGETELLKDHNFDWQQIHNDHQ